MKEANQGFQVCLHPIISFIQDWFFSLPPPPTLATARTRRSTRSTHVVCSVYSVMESVESVLSWWGRWKKNLSLGCCFNANYMDNFPIVFVAFPPLVFHAWSGLSPSLCLASCSPSCSPFRMSLLFILLTLAPLNLLFMFVSLQHLRQGSPRRLQAVCIIFCPTFFPPHDANARVPTCSALVSHSALHDTHTRICFLSLCFLSVY